MISRMGVVSAMTMVSRVFGLFRDIFITAVFGASLLNSAFTAAFALPSLFRRLLGEGALTAALMPNLSEEMEENGREAVFRLVNKTLSWLLVICVLITGLAYGVLFWIEESAVLENWSCETSVSLYYPSLFGCRGRGRTKHAGAVCHSRDDGNLVE